MIITLMTDNHACMKSVMLYISIFLFSKLLEANAIAGKMQQTTKTIPFHNNGHLLFLNSGPMMLNGVIPQTNVQKNTGLNMS